MRNRKCGCRCSGVPDSAGAYCVGVEQAPAALRSAGLLEALATAGADVHDAGDLTTRLWKPDRVRPFVQNLNDETEALLEVAGTASALLEEGARLLVLGGSCMVAVGLCAALARRGERPRLVYVDRHLDLNTPRSTDEGSLSWMGMAHALRLEGAAPELTDAVGPSPLLTPADLVYLGVDATQATIWEREQVQALSISVVSQAKFVADPVGAARQTSSLLSPGPFAVHVDVDVLDFIDAPLAENVNGRNSGPTIEQLGLALSELVQRQECWAVSIGQLVPAHAAADPVALRRFIAALASALAAKSPDVHTTPVDNPPLAQGSTMARPRSPGPRPLGSRRRTALASEKLAAGGVCPGFAHCPVDNTQLRGLRPYLHLSELSARRTALGSPSSRNAPNRGICFEPIGAIPGAVLMDPLLGTIRSSEPTSAYSGPALYVVSYPLPSLTP